MKKILFITPSLSNGGAEKVVSKISSGLNRKNYDVNILNFFRCENEYKIEFNSYLKQATGQYHKFKDVNNILLYLKQCELFEEVIISSLDSGTGEVEMTLSCSEDLYQDILKQLVGSAIEDKGEFIKFLSEAVEAKNEYFKYKAALESVKNNRIYTIPIGFTQMEQVNIFTAEFFYDQANKLYPNIFNYDVNTMLKESIKEWFNVELSDIQIQYMLTGLGPDGEEMY